MNRLEQIAMGFMEAKVLLAAAELRIFDILRGNGVPAEEVARRVGGPLRGAEILLDALVGMGLVAKSRGIYRNRPEYEADLLEESSSHYVALLRHRNLLFRRWARLEEIVTGKIPVDDHAHRPNLTEEEANENFIRAMAAVSQRGAPKIVDRLELRGVRTVADLGGGPGVYLEEIARRSTEIEPYLVDLPITLRAARRILQGSKTARRFRFVEWDLFAADPPSELPALDLCFLSQVVHGEPPEANRALFRKLQPMLAPGGRIVIHERIVDPGRTSPPEASLFAVNMLAMTPGGRVYTEAEILDWGVEAGLSPEAGERIDERSYLVRLVKKV